MREFLKRHNIDSGEVLMTAVFLPILVIPMAMLVLGVIEILAR